MELSKEQTASVEKLLEQSGLSYAPLQQELLDHICCDIETNMAAGYSFEQAQQMTFQIYGKNELLDIQRNTQNIVEQKLMMMKKLFGLTLFFVVAAITLVWTTPQDPPTISPINGNVKITSGFGKRLHPIQKVEKFHKGVDLKVPVGTPVVATSAGVVTLVEYKPNGYGKRVVIQHDEEYETSYSQLSDFKVKKGDKVEKGQVIGLSGNSGMSTAPHLHYEVRKNGVAVNPEEYMTP